MNELEHNWCSPQLAAYLADGLTDEERSRFESHVHECDACTRDLDDARGMEANLRALFAPIAPAEDFEDRMVQRLRQRGVKPRRPLHPLVRRTAIAAAAAIALGSIGYISQRAIQDNGLISPEQIVGSVQSIAQRSGSELAISESRPATRPAATRDNQVYVYKPKNSSATNVEAAANLVFTGTGGNLRGTTTSQNLGARRQASGAIGGLGGGTRGGGAPAGNGSDSVSVVADPNTNTLLVTTHPENWSKVKEVLDNLDRSTPDQVFQLRYANASDVARKINDLYRSDQRDLSHGQTHTFGDASAYSFGNRELGISGSNGYGLTAGRLSVGAGTAAMMKKTGAGSLALGSQSPAGLTMGGATLTGGMLKQPEDDLVVWSAGAPANPIGPTNGLVGDLTTGGNRNITVTGGTTSLRGRSAFSGSTNVQSGIVNTGSGALALGGALRAGDDSINKRGGGVLSVTGDKAVTVNGGTLQLSGSGGSIKTVPVTGQLNTSQAVNVNGGAFNLNGFGQTVDTGLGNQVSAAFRPAEFSEAKDESARDRLRRQGQQQAGQQASGQANSGTLSTARSLGRIDYQGKFTDTRQYNIAGDGTIDFDSGVAAPITVVQGNQDASTLAKIGGGTAAFTQLNLPGGTLNVGAGSVQMTPKSDGTWSTSTNWTQDGGNTAGTVPNSATFGTMSTVPTTQPAGGSVGPIQIAGAIVLDPPIGPSPSAAIERTELALAMTQQPPAAAQPSEGGAAVAGQGQAPTAPQPPPVVQIRRVIREGVMEFEVVSFDSAFAVVTKITAEEGGFVVAADSDRLANGKVRGAITVRVPPDNLDTLILKLRALGDLKSQRLGSKDISKDYTDLESELRAGRAMEERLLEMIKNAQGEVKDLLEAEKELATWRIRLEKIQGQMNYYNNLVSLATLTINAYEKDIRTPATATQTEEINAGIEAEDVDGARTAALKAIDEVKGRIVESSLQQMNAGQFAAKIVADVAPENAGQVVDRLRQIGRVARLDSQKKQTTGTGTTPAQGTSSPAVGPKVEQSPTRLIVSIYNLANVAPRLTTNLNLAADDVEATYRGILARVNQADGRVVSSKLDRQDANQVSGTIQFEVKTGDADAVLNDIRQPVQVLRLNVTENPDTANVTSTKQGFTVQIIPTAQVTPRLTTNLNLAAEDVEATYTAILNRIRESGGRVITSNLNRQDATQATGTIQFELRSGDTDPFMTELRKTVQVLTLNVNENTGAANLTGLKQGFSMQIIPAAQVNPREVRSLAVQTSAVDQGIAKIQSAVATAGGRVLESSMSQDEAGAMIARLVLEVPMDKLEGVTDTVKAQGTVRTSESSRNAQVPDGPLSRGRINLTIGTGESKTIVPATGGFWDTIRGGLSTSIKGLLWSLQLIIIGICLIGPWVLIVWGGAKWYKRNRRAKVEPTT